MIDPLSSIVTLLQPKAAFSKVVHAAGKWRIRREEIGNPFYCVVLEGNCEFTLKGEESIYLTAGDFVLVPEAHAFTVASSHPLALTEADTVPIKTAASTYFVGEAEQELNAHLLIGHCQFEAPDSKILVSLLPKLVHLREAKRLTTLVELVIEESLAQRPGRDSVLARLLEILLIEAFRTKMDTPEVPGLLVGLADERLAIAIRKIHQDVSQSWTIDELAKEASLSRSAFFQRFSKAVGCTPMEYVIAWRMAIAKDLLRRQKYTMATIAERIGYQSASAFSSAFSKHTGQPPSKFLLENNLAVRASNIEFVSE
ncbi:AraC family transcriptional regulator [Marinomonas foliarum]|uniref:AraC family transcriptional regulator n=1 Tax=Marinomonas foliarum TaxID=491950 RepID=A0A368ZLR9_9GAMM|nr:AraC family transcriptional regulator [Marinomonas foliarum]RCW95453.1 AraC family transcriptional regulator [Marinomonas foliarum]